MTTRTNIRITVATLTLIATASTGYSIGATITNSQTNSQASTVSTCPTDSHGSIDTKAIAHDDTTCISGHYAYVSDDNDTIYADAETYSASADGTGTYWQLADGRVEIVTVYANGNYEAHIAR